MTASFDIANDIDVRELIPIKRHELLLQIFKDLPLRENFVFINDHDPLPLYYEFRSIHGDVVGWEYLNKGGREWKVRVTRTGDSLGKDFMEVSTLIDLRKVEEQDWNHVVFHRYSMPTLKPSMASLFRNLKANIAGFIERMTQVNM